MRRIYFYVGVLVLLLVSCISKKKLTTISVEENTENLKFYPNQISKTLKSGLLVEITPISADSLNTEFDRLTDMNGKYNFVSRNRSRQDELLSPVQNKSKEELRFEKAIKNLLDYCKEKDIDDRVSNRLIRDFIKSNGIKIEKLSVPNKIVNNNREALINEFIKLYGKKLGEMDLLKKIYKNPYLIKDKYLSVYKLKLINSTNKILKLSNSDIHIVSGNESLRVFNNNELIALNPNTEDQLLVLRKNLGSELTIYPGDSIVKYVSTTALDKRNTRLNIYVEDKAFQYSTKHSVKTKETKYVYHHIRLNNYSFYNVNTFAYVLDRKGEVHNITVKGKYLLVPENFSGEKLIIFSYGEEFNRYSFGVKKDLDIDKLLKNWKVTCPSLERDI